MNGEFTTMPHPKYFFAHFPDRVTTGILTDLHKQYPVLGRRQDPGRVHMTLRWLGARAKPEPLLEAAQAAVDKSVRFDLTLTRLGAFDNARAVWAGTQLGAKSCSRIQRLHLDLAGPRAQKLHKGVFVPHVTLWKDCRPLGLEYLPINPVEYPVDSVTLVRSHDGRWDKVERWCLT